MAVDCFGRHGWPAHDLDNANPLHVVETMHTVQFSEWHVGLRITGAQNAEAICSGKRTRFLGRRQCYFGGSTTETFLLE